MSILQLIPSYPSTVAHLTYPSLAFLQPIHTHLHNDLGFPLPMLYANTKCHMFFITASLSSTTITNEGHIPKSISLCLLTDSIPGLSSFPMLTNSEKNQLINQPPSHKLSGTPWIIIHSKLSILMSKSDFWEACLWPYSQCWHSKTINMVPTTLPCIC